MAAHLGQAALGVAGPEVAELYNRGEQFLNETEWGARYRAYQLANPRSWYKKHGPIDDDTNVPALCYAVSGYTAEAALAMGKKHLARGVGKVTAALAPHFARSAGTEKVSPKEKAATAAGESEDRTPSPGVFATARNKGAAAVARGSHRVTSALTRGSRGAAAALTRGSRGVASAVTLGARGAATAVKKGKQGAQRLASSTARAARTAVNVAEDTTAVLAGQKTKGERKKLKEAAQKTFDEYKQVFKKVGDLRESRADREKEKLDVERRLKRNADEQETVRAFLKENDKEYEDAILKLQPIEKLEDDYTKLKQKYQALRSVTRSRVKNTIRRLTRRGSSSQSTHKKRMKEQLDKMEVTLSHLAPEKKKLVEIIEEYTAKMTLLSTLEGKVEDLNEEQVSANTALRRVTGEYTRGTYELGEIQEEAKRLSNEYFTVTGERVGWLVSHGGGDGRGTRRVRRRD